MDVDMQRHRAKAKFRQCWMGSLPCLRALEVEVTHRREKKTFRIS